VPSDLHDAPKQGNTPPGDGDGVADVRALLRSRAARYRAAPVVSGSAAADEGHVAMVVFERCGARYGIALDALEVLQRARAITRLPGVSPVIQGLERVRGRVVAVHDLGCFGRPPQALGGGGWLLVGRGVAASVALLADDVDGVRIIDPTLLRAPPISLAGRRSCYLGFDEHGTAFLDFERLVQNEDFFHA
jgi:purine-binding chemotaxis protein CheW